MGSKTQPKYPIINLNEENTKPGSNSWLSTCQNIKNAFEEFGFFVAVQEDGLISAEHNTRIYHGLENLFNLPKEIKAKRTSDTVFFFDYQEATRISPENTSIEDCTSLEAVENFTKLMWPAGNTLFCETVHLYTKKASQLHEMLIRMVFSSYGLEKYCDSHNESFTFILRLMKYLPPNSEEPSLGVTAHTDKDWFTILHQINPVNGLQIKPKNEDYWVDVDVPPLSLVVFAGDSLTAWSNGRIHSVLHRLLMRGKETRYSIAQFSFLTKTLPLQVPEELVDDDHPLLYKPFDNLGLLYFYATPEGRKAQNLLKAYCGT